MRISRCGDTPPAQRGRQHATQDESGGGELPVLPALFVVWCLLHDWRRNRTVHPVFARGGFAIMVAWPLRLIIGPSEWYRPNGEWITRVDAGM